MSPTENPRPTFLARNWIRLGLAGLGIVELLTMLSVALLIDMETPLLWVVFLGFSALWVVFLVLAIRGGPRRA